MTNKLIDHCLGNREVEAAVQVMPRDDLEQVAGFFLAKERASFKGIAYKLAERCSSLIASTFAPLPASNLEVMANSLGE